MDFRRFSVWLVACLLVSNLAVGTLSLIFLQKLNRQYAGLFEHSVPVVNDLRTLTREMSAVQRLARRIVDPANEPAWKELLPEMAATSAKVTALAREISQEEILSANGMAGQIIAGNREYEARAQEYLALAQGGRLAEANRFNNDNLRPAYDDYQARLEDAAESIERHAKDLRAQYTQDSRVFGGLLLVLGGWPLLVAVLFVLVMALMVSSLLVTVFVPRFDLTKRLFRTESDR